MSEPMGFFTDTTVCIGCKACEVACKEWNQLPAANGGVRPLSGELQMLVHDTQMLVVDYGLAL